MRKTLEERFWEKVNKASGLWHIGLKGQCWIWVAGRFGAGYGEFSIQNHPRLAHQVVLELGGLDIPYGMEVMHLCQNKTCINPSHLQIATRSEHLRYDYAAGVRDGKKGAAKRMGNRNGSNTCPHSRPRGENNGNSKLNRPVVRIVRQLHGSMSSAEVGEVFGVDPSLIRYIWRREIWKHV